MSNENTGTRDAFTFSLGGQRGPNGFCPVPVIADDRINRAWDERLHGKGAAARATIERRDRGMPAIGRLLRRYLNA